LVSNARKCTTTKALFDFLNVLQNGSALADQLLRNFSFLYSNVESDGADMYTRLNANEVDLNRDSQNLTQPESKVLREIFDLFQPHYCFNLHDQRTILE
jgi:murein tripeptide amidase MpaA